MKRAGHILLAAFAVAALLPPQLAYGQKKGAQAPAAASASAASVPLPQWVDDAWRARSYPPEFWYSGYSHDAVRPGDNAAAVQKRVEKEAQNRLAEGIVVRIAATSTTQTHSAQVKTSAGTTETIKKDYGQIIEASTSAEVAKVDVRSHYDQAGGRVYAFASVRKSDLAAYYTSRIESYLQSAENDIKLAKQFADSDKKGSALERFASAKKSIGECGKYHELLGAVDFKGDAVKRLVDKGAAFLREISVIEVKLRDAGAVHITGSETIAGKPVNKIVAGIQARFSANKCRVADTPQDAGYILTVEAEECNTAKSGSFFYCCACVNADLVNTNTGKSESKLSFTGPKEGWNNEKRACDNAFEKAVETLWKDLVSKTEVCK